ncbi:MAG TPA: hypothetical protein PLW72_09195 [Burkholderiaceae bacterium]|nr:hypothetical protein [Burkholderiaceae bacterium]HQR78115.1 hypothetical protein [Burkholderiaceae bacterium]
MIQEHFPLAALVTLALPIMAGDGALFILCLAGMIVMLPFVYGQEVDEIVETTVARSDDRR